MSKMLILRTTFLFLLVSVSWCEGLQRVCYLTIDHRPFANQLHGFQGDLCTHVNVMPVSVDAEGKVSPTEAGDEAKYAKVQELRLINPDLKILATLITVPGVVFSDATRDADTRQTFARNILNFILEHKFDGIDIDWEFPVFSSMRIRDKQNFVLLLREIRRIFDSRAEKKLLSVAVAADVTIVNMGYDAVGINSTVDYINLMSYDYTDWHWYYPFVGHNAPLFPFSSGPYFKQLNMEFSANYWHQLGVDKSKIMVGIPTYSHTFYLLTPGLNFPGAPAMSEGPEFTYSEVCQFLEQSGSVRRFDELASVPYAFNDTIWITYEDEVSAAIKATWIRDHGFGGSMTYNINNDDMDGRCGPNGHPFALQRVIRSLLK